MIASITQRLFYFPCRWFFKVFWGLEVRGTEHIAAIQKPILIIANHRTLLDSWLIGASLPFRSEFFPVRYIGGSKFSFPLNVLYFVGIIPFIYWIFGVFTLPRDGSLEEKIQPIIGLLKRGETVMMFPEGKRYYHNGIGEFKKGAAEIALRTGVPVFPIAHRSISSNGSKKTVLVFGKPMKLVVQDNTNVRGVFYEEVADLYNNCLKRLL